MTRNDGPIADVADIRRRPPLPETAVELCDVAHDLGVDPKTHLYLGAMATGTQVKQLSEDGSLAKYKIVHFATHGAVAGQVLRTSGPGLLVIPPERGSEIDDGYLSSSEIISLKLDADWVILSACNTAAGEATGAGVRSDWRARFSMPARTRYWCHTGKSRRTLRSSLSPVQSQN
jgi:CHAT domain-containing protein